MSVELVLGQSEPLSLDDEQAEPRREPSAARGVVRRLDRRDIPQVCSLFANTFRAGRRVARADVEACLEATYLTSPHDRLRPASLVDTGADGRVVGFMGIIGFGASIGGRTLRAGALGNFMAEPQVRARSGVKLARATCLQSDLDFVFTDTANRTSMELATALKFAVLPQHTLEWVKLLQPFGAAACKLGRTRPVLGLALGPLARLCDLGARRMRFAALPKARGAGVIERHIEASRFAAEAPAFIGRYGLRPDWSKGELSWILDQASKKARNGPLRLREVCDGAGRILGLYAVYIKPGGVAHALQVLSLEGTEPVVIGALIRYAAAAGAVAVRGAISPSVIGGLIRQDGIVCHHVATTLAFTRDPTLRAPLLSSDAFIGGLFGEGWTRLVADEFG